MCRRSAWLAVALQLACASAPGVPAGRSAAWGYLEIVPREGVADATSGSHAYGDRRYAAVPLVDYTRPGFAVVYAEDGEADAAPRESRTVALEIRATTFGPRLEPAHAALGAGDTLAVANRTGEVHALSIPAAGLVRRLAPDEIARIPIGAPGEWNVFLLDAPGEAARVFAAPGPFAVVSSAGRFELSDLPPGRRRLGAWHPRFPPASAWVELAPGRASRVDFALGVDRREGTVGDAP